MMTNHVAMTTSNYFNLNSVLQNCHHYISLKFSHEGYLFWKALLNPFFARQGLYRFIDGSNTCPYEYI